MDGNIFDEEAPSPEELIAFSVQEETWSFRLIREWIIWLPISDGAFRSYCRLFSLSKVSASTGEADPGWMHNSTIATILGVGLRSWERYREELVDAGLLKVQEQQRRKGGQYKGTLYQIQIYPPGGGMGLESPRNGEEARKAADTALRRDREEKARKAKGKPKGKPGRPKKKK